MEAACVTKTTPVISTVSTEILARYKHYKILKRLVHIKAAEESK